MRGLDHIVHLVKNLDAAGAHYEALGFQVGARNIHPFGTHNRIVQFNGFFIELLEVVSPQDIGTNPFALFNRVKQVEGFEGATMLVLEGTAQDKPDFISRGIYGDASFSFERAGLDAKGQPTKVAFDLVFAQVPDIENRPIPLPEFAFFTCLQHFPENFWSALKQQHKNGASDVLEVVFTAENPSDYADFFGHFTGNRDMRASSLGVFLETPRGLITLTSPEHFKARFGVSAPLNPPFALGAVVLKGKTVTQNTLNNLVIRIEK
jgi:Glyoxalase-like domain